MPKLKFVSLQAANRILLEGLNWTGLLRVALKMLYATGHRHPITPEKKQKNKKYRGKQLFLLVGTY